MRIGIVTLNFNNSKETLELLRSLIDQTDFDFETIVVDNASEESDFINLQTNISTSQVDYPQVKVVRNRENLGFSEGNNVGIRQTLKNGSDWVVLLNNDTWVERDFVERLRAVLSAKNGVVGIPLTEESQIAYCGKIQWLKPTLIHMTDLRCRSVDKSQVYAIGGAMAVHKDIFEKISLLDEKYFLYFG